MNRSRVVIAACALVLAVVGLPMVLHMLHPDPTPLAPSPQQQCTSTGSMYIALPSGRTYCTSTIGLFR